jgi:hypothetical protein
VGDPAARGRSAPIDDRAMPFATLDYGTGAQAALLYRAASRTGCRSTPTPPLPSRRAERPISHGLNNLGLACRAILKACAGPPRAAARLAARFVAPGRPATRYASSRSTGTTRTGVRATAIERVRLLDRGSCDLHG